MVYSIRNIFKPPRNLFTFASVIKFSPFVLSNLLPLYTVFSIVHALVLSLTLLVKKLQMPLELHSWYWLFWMCILFGIGSMSLSFAILIEVQRFFEIAGLIELLVFLFLCVLLFFTNIIIIFLMNLLPLRTSRFSPLFKFSPF